MPQQKFVKLTLESRGIWDKIRRFFALDPERSSGVPLNASYRNPSPGSNPKPYHEAPLLPNSDIAENPYYARDTRRKYAVPSSFDQSRLSALLAAPAAKEGLGGGETAIVATKDLHEVLAQTDADMPAFPGKSFKWKIVDEPEAGYGSPGEYPVRMFT